MFVGSDQIMNVGSFDLDPMKNFSRKIIRNDDDFEVHVVVEARGVQAGEVMPKNEDGRKFSSSTVMVDGDGITLVSVPDTIPVVSAHDETILPLVVKSPVSIKEKNQRIKRSRDDDALHNNNARYDGDSNTRYSHVVRSTPCTRNDDERTQPRGGRDPPGRKHQYQYVSHQSQWTLH